MKQKDRITNRTRATGGGFAVVMSSVSIYDVRMKVQRDVPLSRLCFFRIGGPADYLYEVETKADLARAFAMIRQKNLPYYFLGSGSNVLVADAGFRGVIIKAVNKKISFLEPATVHAETGAQNSEIYRFAKEHNLDYSPFFTIPGTLGGAIAGNAGIPAGEIKDCLQSAEVFDAKHGAFVTVDASFFRFGYRHSLFHEMPLARRRFFVWSADLALPHVPAAEIEHKAQEYLAMRKAKQPWGKTGGSFFKNPPEGAAGHFLEQAGAKQMREGGAFFSEKHANFLMSDGTATQADVMRLARRAMAEVRARFGIELHSEVILLDEQGEEIKL